MTMKDKITEQPSHYDHLEQMSVGELLQHINDEDALVAEAVRKALPQIIALVEAIEPRMKRGGRLFYIGAGTSGRLGVLDASELPPTFGVSPEIFIGVMAGGEKAVFNAAENKEDIKEDGANAMVVLQVCEKDAVIGISASGGAKFVVGALNEARRRGASTVCITSNDNTPLTEAAEIGIVVDTGAEVITGSTRMKAGTAQKVILNMISTSVMVKCGYVYENLMINLKPTNEKLKKRCVGIVSEITGEPYEVSEKLLEDNQWDIKRAVNAHMQTK